MNPYASEPTHEIREAADLFGGYQMVRTTRRTSNRAELIRYFHDRARDREGKPYRKSYIGFRLAHLSEFDLSAFKSDLEDRKRRFPHDFNWNHAFFGGIKPKPRD